MLVICIKLLGVVVEKVCECVVIEVVIGILVFDKIDVRNVKCKCVVVSNKNMDMLGENVDVVILILDIGFRKKKFKFW